ncbi:MAG: chemotaxis protein CheX [Gammaproteobacteria bacterium]|nr:chemotaxis protein CheX [Gammaproteobacteria bacterium]
MINEQELSVFVESALEFFYKNTGIAASMDEPRIELIDPPIRDVVGLIEISGVAKGFVYTTAKREDITHLLNAMGEKEVDGFMIQDIVGELASIISSNARHKFGDKFKVSVPKILVPGGRKVMETSLTVLVLPIRWRSAVFEVVIGVELDHQEMSHEQHIE